MSGGIEALPDVVVQQIAAGEVIDSLAAVVRELIDNALDAGATRLTIEVDPQHWRVVVADNGQGMSCEDLQQAALAHTTSKIRAVDDLQCIQSLGFRGEALHSLAVLGNLEIHSASQATQEGWCARYAHDGTIMDLKPVAIAGGTIVIVSHLFQAWPSRQKSLPSVQKQLKAVQGVIQNAALTHPWIIWQVKRQSQPWFNLWPGAGTHDILVQLLPRLDSQSLRPLQIPLTLAPDFPTSAETQSETTQAAFGQLELVIGLPDRYHRQRPDWVKVAVNRRIIKIPDLEQTILSGFARTVPRDRFPFCWAHFLIPSLYVDWNRHPAKTDIYLQQLPRWQHALETAIQEGLGHSLSPVSPVLSHRLQRVLKASEASGFYRQISSPTQASLESTDPVDPDSLQLSDPGPETRSAQSSELALFPPSKRIELRAIAQLHKTYIVAEHPNGLWLVEQHIAHERVLYEQLCDRWLIVPLHTPVLLNHLTPEQRSQLLRLGIECEPFGEETWAIRSAPSSLVERPDCAESLWELSLGSDLQSAQVATACRSAIRNGIELNLSAMQNLLNQWQQTAYPRTCPHGRPIYLELAESHLSRYFRRHWVIGKSHGI